MDIINVKLVKAYGFTNEANESLTLQLGRLMDENGNTMPCQEAQRWRFIGRNIPMPVRSGTWFEGMSFGTMRNWLENRGWQLQSSVSFITGSFTIFQRGNKNYDSQKKNENISTDNGTKAPYESVSCFRQSVIDRGLVSLYKENKSAAVYIYELLHNGDSLSDAIKALTKLSNARGGDSQR